MLVDGMPLGRLPDSIRKSLVYTRCFGNRDFEVSREKGVLKTVRATEGYYYEFAMVSLMASTAAASLYYASPLSRVSTIPHILPRSMSYAHIM